MKAKAHLQYSLFIAVYVLPFFLALAAVRNSVVLLPAAVFGVVLIVLGSILPDSDSEDAGSRIFHTVFASLAYLFNFMEKPIARLLKKKIGHRQALHTVPGIIITSFVLVFLIAVVMDIFRVFSFVIVLIFFLCLLFGQLLHLLQDQESHKTVMFLANVAAVHIFIIVLIPVLWVIT